MYDYIINIRLMKINFSQYNINTRTNSIRRKSV